jgi:hypothetical protein
MTSLPETLSRTEDSKQENTPGSSGSQEFGNNTPKKLWAFLPALAALALVSFFALSQVSRWPNRLRYPGEEDAAEGTQLSEMVHLRRGIHIYRVPAGGEFDGAVYGPLCYLAGAALINPNHPSYLPLRLLSLVATLGLLVASALFVFKLTKNKMAAVLAPLLLLSTAYIGRYGISARADMLALLLAFTGFLVFFNNRKSRRALALAAGFMLLSFFYKQQFIGAPLSVFCYLLIIRRFRRALEFAGMMAAGGSALMGIFTFLIFPHQAFLLHFITFNHLPFEKQLILPEILMFVVPLFVPLLGSAEFVDQKKDQLISCYAVISVAGYFLLLFSSGSGADTNRCLEAVVVLSCLFASRIATAGRPLSGFAWTGALAFTLLLVAQMGSAFVVPTVTATDFTTDAVLQKYLRDNFPTGTSVLSYYPGDSLRAGLEAPVTNLWHYSALIRNGVLADRDIDMRIDRGGYGAILLDFDLTQGNSEGWERRASFYTTQSLREAVLRGYEQVGCLPLPEPEITRFSDGRLCVWVPRATGSGDESTQHFGQKAK